MTDNKKNWKRIWSFAGAFVAFMTGAGFATGQEVLQYFASYGLSGFRTIIVCFLLLAFASVNYTSAGYRELFTHGSLVFRYYCGKWVGGFFDYFTVFVVYLSFVVILAGAGATLHQQYGFPHEAGVIIMACLSGITVLMGFQNIVDVMARIGPASAAVLIAISIIAAIKGDVPLSRLESAMAGMELMRASSNWLFSAFSYVGISLIWLASFLATLGASADGIKEARYGAIVGVAGFSIAIAVITVALMRNFTDVNGTMIPMLVLAGKVNGLIAKLFSLVIYIGIYTTAVPLLWTASSRLVKEKAKGNLAVVFLMVAVGSLVAILVSFNKLVNIVYVIGGYIGFAMLLFMILKLIRRHIAKIRLLR